jgi:hypothetical protein
MCEGPRSLNRLDGYDWIVASGTAFLAKVGALRLRGFLRGRRVAAN